jgi:PAS domain-containing protein
VVAPLLFVWCGHGRGALPRRRLPEALLLLVTVGVLSLAIFGDLLDPIHPHFPYLVFPPLIWAALRLGPHGAVTTTALVAASAIWGTVQGEGPFARATLQESLVVLQVFMSVVAVTMLVFAAVVAERQRAEDARVWFAAMVESSEDAIIGKTLEGIITSWNPGAERLYGYTAAEMHGQSIARLIPPELPDDLPQLLAQIRRGNDWRLMKRCGDTRMALGCTSRYPSHRLSIPPDSSWAPLRSPATSPSAPAPPSPFSSSATGWM